MSGSKQDLVNTDRVFSPYEIPPCRQNERPDGSSKNGSANEQSSYESVNRDLFDLGRFEVVRPVAECVDREGLGGVPPQHGSTYESAHQAETGEGQQSNGRRAALPLQNFSSIATHARYPMRNRTRTVEGFEQNTST